MVLVGILDISGIFEVMTATDTRIDLPLLEYSKRRNVQLKEAYLLLGEKYMQYKIAGTYEAINEDTGIWEDKQANYRWVRPRANLSEVTMYYDNPEKLYSLSIDFIGISDANNWLFATGKKALVVYEQLLEYMITR